MIKGCLTHQGRKTQQQRARMGEGFSTSLKRRTSRHKYIGNHWHKYVGNHCHKYVGNHCHKYVSYHCHKYVSNYRPDLMVFVAVTNKYVCVGRLALQDMRTVSLLNTRVDNFSSLGTLSSAVLNARQLLSQLQDLHLQLQLFCDSLCSCCLCWDYCSCYHSSSVACYPNSLSKHSWQ